MIIVLQIGLIKRHKHVHLSVFLEEFETLQTCTEEQHYLEETYLALNQGWSFTYTPQNLKSMGTCRFSATVNFFVT